MSYSFFLSKSHNTVIISFRSDSYMKIRMKQKKKKKSLIERRAVQAVTLIYFKSEF